MTVWVDQIFGNDTHSGLSPSTAVKTLFKAGFLSASIDTINILPGIYADDFPSFTDKDLTFNGKGNAVIQYVSAAGTDFMPIHLSGVTANRTYKFNNLIFENWQNIIRHRVTSGAATFTFHAFFDNCVIYRIATSPNSSVVRATNDRATPATPIDPSVHLENCTLRNLDYAYYTETVQPGNLTLDVNWERNNIYDVAVSVAFVGPGAIVNRNASNYNALPNADILGANDFAITATPPNYTSTIAPINLAIVRATSPVYIGSGGDGPGEFGADIGASWWPVSPPDAVDNFVFRSSESQTTDFFGENWTTTGWANDPLWYDTSVPGPGTDAVSAGETDSSPALLLTGLDPRWVISPYIGDGQSCRVLSPVLNSKQLVIFQGVSFWGTENPTLPSGEKEIIDINGFGATREIEFRFSDTPFLSNSALPSWNPINRTSVPIVGQNQYWQFRIILRRNGLS